MRCGGPGGGRSYSSVMNGGRTAGGPVGGGVPPEIRWGWDGCFPGGGWSRLSSITARVISLLLLSSQLLFLQVEIIYLSLIRVFIRDASTPTAL